MTWTTCIYLTYIHADSGDGTRPAFHFVYHHIVAHAVRCWTGLAALKILADERHEKQAGCGARAVTHLLVGLTLS